MFGKGYGDEQHVDVLSEEVVQGGFVKSAVPRAWEDAIWIAGAGDDVAGVLFAFRCLAGGGCEGYYVHSHCFADLCSCVFS